MSDQKFVQFRGRKVIEGWPQKLAAAQLQTTYSIGGKSIPRIPYGSESDDWGADKVDCHDCGATKAEYHVTGCDVEECPRCNGQAFSCDCPYDDDEDEDASEPT